MTSQPASPKLEANCPACRLKFQAPLKHAGKSLRCRCGQVIKFPEIAPLARKKPVPASEPAPTPVLTHASIQSEPPSVPENERDPGDPLAAISLPRPTASPQARGSNSSATDRSEVSCQHCRARYRVQSSSAGKSFRCRCGQVLTIPQPRSSDEVRTGATEATPPENPLENDFAFDFERDL